MLRGSDQSGFENSLLMKKHPRFLLLLQLAARVQAFRSESHLLLFQKQRESVPSLGSLHGASTSGCLQDRALRFPPCAPRVGEVSDGLLLAGGGDLTACTYPTFQHLQTLSHNYGLG